jgi:signal transduction histidine kinase/ActR/RegA family two-component response regulator
LWRLLLAAVLWTGDSSAWAATLRDSATTPMAYVYRDLNNDTRPDQLGKSVTVRGVLTIRPSRSNETWIAYLQDDTGALRLLDRHPRRFANFDEGDEVVARGVLSPGELRVEEAQMIRNGESPKPRDVWTTDLANRRFQSQLVRVTGELVRGPRDRQLEFLVRDMSGETPLILQPEFFMNNKGEFGHRLWKGGQVKVVGVAIRNTNTSYAGLSLMLRRSEDIEFMPPPPPPPSKVPLYSALGIAALLGLLALYYWERRRAAEQRERETKALLHELKRSQAEIKKQASFAQLNPNPVVELFADGTLTYWNDAAKEMAERLECRYVRDLLPPDLDSLVSKCLNQPALRQRAEVKLKGRTISWSLFAIPEITSVHGYAADITEQLSLEAQLRQVQKIESVGQLAAGVAHDFNNMLAVIQGYTTLTLMRPDLPAKVSEPLHEILSAAERAGNLTRQLLTFSRKQVMEPRTVELNDLVKNLAKMLRRLIGEDVRLKVTPHESPALLHADPGMLEQVIVNLAVNARDAMPDGGELCLAIHAVTLTEIEAARSAEARPGDYFVTVVSDNGCGMDEGTMKRIFEPFFTTKEPGKGTGLGLATVHGIVKQHGGWIEVASEPGVGTTFRIYLPAAQQAEMPTSDKVIRLPTTGGSETILLVEDDPAVRKYARGVLEEYGYRVFEAASAAEAMAIWNERSEQIRLLFTDLVLPEGINGWKLAEALRSRNGELKVIYSTGFDSDAFGGRFRLDPQMVLLRKPYPVQSLVHAVRNSLDNRAVAEG